MSNLWSFECLRLFVFVTRIAADFVFFRKINVYKLKRATFSSKLAIKLKSNKHKVVRNVKLLILIFPRKQWRNVSVFESLRRYTSVFKNLHPGERFRKPSFSVTNTFVFDRMCGRKVKTNKKRKLIKRISVDMQGLRPRSMLQDLSISRQCWAGVVGTDWLTQCFPIFLHYTTFVWK